MTNTHSLKLKKWDRKDIVKSVLICFVNYLIMFALFLGRIAIEHGKDGFYEYVSSFSTMITFGLLLLFIVAIVFIYYFFTDRDFIKSGTNNELVFLIIELSYMACFALGRYVSVYLRPFTLTALFSLFLINKRSAIFINTVFGVTYLLFDVFATGISNVSAVEYVSIILAFVSGTLVAFLMDEIYSRIRLLLTSVLMSIPIFIYSGIRILTVAETGDIVTVLVCSFFSGPTATVIFIIFLPFFEMLFRKVTSFKLAELTDHKHPLIARLINEAPGTFNHSIIVSNIAEACATAIGEDALFARTCAYYHDIGKLRRPEFFTENQTEGENPHDDLTPELSVSIIKAHTENGYELLIKNRISKDIADMCLQHHGTMPIIYFYEKAKKFNDGEVDMKPFYYSGPKPQTKIAAILMIADGSEAATRTLKDRSRENVEKVVRGIIDNRMELGQFDECEITIKELEIITHTIVNNLSGIYHSRIAYPKISMHGLDRIKKEIEHNDGKA